MLTRAPLYGLEELNEASGADLALAAGRDFPWALRTIRLSDFKLDARAKVSAFPKLEELGLARRGMPSPSSGKRLCFRS